MTSTEPMTEAAAAAGRAASSAQQEIMRLLHAPLITQALAVAAELGIADQLAGGARPVQQLAAEVGADPDALHRLLRALATVGVFDEVAPRTFASTPLADTLREGPGSLRNWARLWGIQQRNAAIAAMLFSVRTGEPSFPHLHGTSWWAQLAGEPEQAAVFAAAMGDLSRQLHAATVAAYDLTGVGRLVDVGGGHGHLVAALLRRYPTLRASVYDQPAVVEHARAALTEAGVGERAQVLGGDFFSDVPAGGDVYLMSMILHDWNDNQCVSILRSIRRALPATGRLLVVDAIIPPGNAAHDGKLRDLIMLVLHPGRERTEEEFAALFQQAGLRLVETREVAASTGLLVAVPA